MRFSALHQNDNSRDDGTNNESMSISTQKTMLKDYAKRNGFLNCQFYVDMKRRQLREISFSDLTQQEEDQLCTYDTYFANDEAEKSFFVAGKEITAKLLAETLHSLPDDKREAVLLHYFFDMNDAEIAKLQNIPRSTVQYRRTSSFDLLKRYLEKHTYGKDW